MRFLHGKLQAKRGNIIRVNFSEPTRVLIMEERDFNRYKNNQTFTYYGGHQAESPFEFVLPRATTWFVVVEKGPYYAPKDVTAEIQIVKLPQVILDQSADDSSEE